MNWIITIVVPCFIALVVLDVALIFRHHVRGFLRRIETRKPQRKPQRFYSLDATN